MQAGQFVLELPHLFAGQRSCAGCRVARVRRGRQRRSHSDWSVGGMQTSCQTIIVSLRISGHGISNVGVRGVGNCPHHIGEVRLRI